MNQNYSYIRYRGGGCHQIWTRLSQTLRDSGIIREIGVAKYEISTISITNWTRLLNSIFFLQVYQHSGGSGGVLRHYVYQKTVQKTKMVPNVKLSIHLSHPIGTQHEHNPP